MKATIDVETRAEADRIKAALNDPTTRAFVNVMGALQPLRRSAQERVLRFVEAHLAEAQEGQTDGR